MRPTSIWPGGRPSPEGSSSERAGITVRKAVAVAILTLHARGPHVRTGHSCTVNPITTDP